MGLGNFIALAADKKLKVLAVSGQRSKLMPDVPTFAEVGIGDFPGCVWWGLAGPKGMSPALVARINAEFVKVWRDPKFVEFLEQQAVGFCSGHSRRVCRSLCGRTAPPRKNSWKLQTLRSDYVAPK